MKVSKSLLQAIAIGITIGAASSCEALRETNELHLDSCMDGCTTDHAQERGNGDVAQEPFDCPACGLG